MLYEANTKSHSVGWSLYHLQWCTKYRYKIFKQEKLKNLCEIAIREAGTRHRIEIEEIEVQPDHVHLIAKIPLRMSASEALNLLKGFSSRLIFLLVPKYKLRYPQGHLWSKGKFAGSVGHMTLEVAKQYVKNQEAHHAKSNQNLHPLGWGVGQFLSV
jgi:putative transposase